MLDNKIYFYSSFLSVSTKTRIDINISQYANNHVIVPFLFFKLLY